MGLKDIVESYEATGAREFRTTHWTIILAAACKDDSKSAAALEQLCCSYRPAIYAFLRHRGYAHHKADDLTQGFFQHLLAKEILARVKPEKGRFRSYLLTALMNFIRNEWHRDMAGKRGEGQVPINIDDTDQMRHQSILAAPGNPDILFDQQWALTLLDKVLKQLREEFVSRGNGALFQQLQTFLPGSQCQRSYAEVSQALGMKEASLRMKVKRLRTDYRELLEAEIAATVSSPEEIGEEIRYLKEVLTKA